MVVGVVHNPILGETFTATRGGSALLNGQPIHVSSESDLASALVATEVTDVAVVTHRARFGSDHIAGPPHGETGTWMRDAVIGIDVTAAV